MEWKKYREKNLYFTRERERENFKARIPSDTTVTNIHQSQPTSWSVGPKGPRFLPTYKTTALFLGHLFSLCS